MYGRRKMRTRQGLSRIQIITLSFLLAIMIGSLILMLPIMSANGESTDFVDALFTATTSVCITGLVIKLRYVLGSTNELLS